MTTAWNKRGYPTRTRWYEDRQRLAHSRIENNYSKDGSGKIVACVLMCTGKDRRIGRYTRIAEYDLMQDAADHVGLDSAHVEPYDRVEYETAEDWERDHAHRDGYEFLRDRFAEITGKAGK